MELTQSKEINLNYAAKIVDIRLFSPHPNPKVERLKCCVVDGYNITVSKDTEPGLYIYFPTECCLNPKFLSANNLYRDNMKNQCPDVSGFFEDSGRVKIIKLQQHPSEGLIMPISSLYEWLALEQVRPPYNIKIEAGTIFDSVEGKVLCKKYIPKYTRTPGQPGSRTRAGRTPTGISKIIDKQFRFHYDTVKLKSCPNVIHPDDIISITAKVHGTSGISSYVLCKEDITPWWAKVLSCLPGVSIRKETESYDYLYSSRKVIKNEYYNPNVTEGYYGVDVWKYADDVIRPALTKGLTVYYEIIGFLPNGGAIQSLGNKPYDYGYTPPKEGEKYTYGVHFGVQVYRVTYTNVDGLVYEFSAKQVQQWAITNGLIPVEEYYYGYAKDLYPYIKEDEEWNNNFITCLSNSTNFNMERPSPKCKSGVPHEGIVIKIENSQSMAYKLKCIKFLDGESADLDKGIIDIESES